MQTNIEKINQLETLETTVSTVEPVTMSEVLSLATWDRPRTNEELRDFISQRESMVGL